MALPSLSPRKPKGAYHWLLVLAVLLAGAVLALLFAVSQGWLPPVDRLDGGGAALRAVPTSLPPVGR
jgi:hypothetical protein